MLNVLSLLCFGILGIGYPICRPVLLDRRWGLQQLGLVFSAGLLALFICGLITPSLRMLWYGGWILALPGYAIVMFDLLRGRFLRPQAAIGLDALCLTLVLFVCFGVAILATPITEWDARSIWFFHSKIVYFADRMMDWDSWRHPSLAWAHADYPKLNAFLAALSVVPLGTWNEYLPKISLILLNIPLLLLSVGAAPAFSGQVLTLCLITLKVGSWLWNGYMDGILAGYVGLTALYGAYYAAYGERKDAAIALVTAGISMSLKNEGLVMAATILALTALSRWWRLRRPSPRKFLAAIDLRQLIVIGLVAFLPFCIWSLAKAASGIGSEFTQANALSERLRERLASPLAIQQIVEALFPENSRFGLKLFAGLTVFLGLWKEPRRRLIVLLPTWGAALCYAAVLLCVYLATPYDLPWHLSTSASRTVLALHALFVAGPLALVLASEATPVPAGVVDYGDSNHALTSSDPQLSGRS